MYPSNPPGIGIPSPFGATPSSVHAGSNQLDDSCPAPFNWLTQFGGHSSAVLNDQSASGSLKIGSSDPVMDRSSFMNFDHHTTSFSRGGSGNHGMDSLANQQHHQQQQQTDGGGGGGGGAIVGPFHSYRPASDSISAAVAHPSPSNSHFAAFDSVYKAYQNAFGSGTATAPTSGMYGNPPYRYDGSLMAAEQQTLMQASMLQYPHIGFFPNVALYPGLQPGYRNSVDYYCQNMASLSLLSQYQDLAATNWLGAERLSAVSSLSGEREKEGKDFESSREQLEFSKRFEKESFEHHKMRHDRDDGRHESKVEESRKEHNHSNSSGSGRHLAEKGLRNEQIKQSIILRSPTKHDQRHSESNLHRINAGQIDCSFGPSRSHTVSRASMAEPLNLQKPPMSPIGIVHRQKHAIYSKNRDHHRPLDLPQQYSTTKERHQTSHSKTEDIRDKKGTLAVNLPKPASTMTPFVSSQLKGQYEQKFHRPFEQLHRDFTSSGNDRSETLDRQFEILSYASDRSYNNSKTSPVLQHKENVSRSVPDDKGSGHESRNQPRYHHHHHRHYQQQQQQQSGKQSDKKILTSSVYKRRLSDMNDELPLNLAMSKVALLNPTTAVAAGGGRESEPSLARLRSNLAMHETLALKIENNHSKKKIGGSVMHDNSSVCRNKAKTNNSGQLDVCRATNRRKPAISKLEMMPSTKKMSTSDENLDCIGEMGELGIASEVEKHLLTTPGPLLTEEHSPRKLHFLELFGLVAIEVSQAESKENGHQEEPTLPMIPAKSTSLHQNDNIHHRRLEDTAKDTAKAATVSPKSMQSYDGHNAKCDYGQQQKRSGSDFRRQMLSLNTSDRLQQFSCTATSAGHLDLRSALDLRSGLDPTASRQKGRLLDSNRSDGSSTPDCYSNSVLNGGGETGVRKELVEDLVFSSRACLASDAVSKMLTPNCSSSDSTSIQKESPDDSLSVMQVAESEPFVWPGHEAVTESYYHYMEERSLERHLIRKHDQRLHLLNSDLVQKLQQLQNHMAGLMDIKDALAENQIQLQSKIDSLKTSIKAFQ